MNLSWQLKTFVSNKHGKVVMWQVPNFLLWLWIVLKVLGLILHDGPFKTGLGLLSSAVLFTWAYLEITEGESQFRRLLGTVIITLTVVSFFT
jgi:hypothetical protein